LGKVCEGLLSLTAAYVLGGGLCVSLDGMYNTDKSVIIKWRNTVFEAKE